MFEKEKVNISILSRREVHRGFSVVCGSNGKYEDKGTLSCRL